MNSNVCVHGSLKRQCQLCDQIAEIEELRQQLAEAQASKEAAIEDFKRRAIEVCNKIVRVATIPESTTEAFSGYSRAMKHNEIKQEIESLPAFEEKGE